tara:strand:+ start:2268 stop:2582 length:315 start_codon:yes stop_codon:yes gene_type:complete
MKTPDAIGSDSSPVRSKLKQLGRDDSQHKLSFKAKSRADRDTIELSDGSQTAINLARATELGAKLPNADTNPKGFSDALKQGYKDIKRIIRLFSEVLTLLRRRL